jgi:hypothetical protein
MSRTLRTTALALSALTASKAAPAQEATSLRADLRDVEARLDQAVARVSRTNAGFFLAGAASCHGYYLPGYGVVFVLPPRDWPRGRMILRGQARAMMPGARGGSESRLVFVGPDRRQLQMLEEQVDAFQREAEEARVSAEQAFEEMSRAMRARLAPRPGSDNPTPAPPGGPETPPPPAPVPEAPEPSPLARVPLLPPRPAPGLHPLPGDQRTANEDLEELEAPETVVANVRTALVAALESQDLRLTSLRPDDMLTVAVDFVAGVPFFDEVQPSHSLVLRVAKKDLDARQAGRLGPADFQGRIEVVEY